MMARTRTKVSPASSWAMLLLDMAAPANNASFKGRDFMLVPFTDLAVNKCILRRKSALSLIQIKVPCA
jgi:hypothetical protein